MFRGADSAQARWPPWTGVCARPKILKLLELNVNKTSLENSALRNSGDTPQSIAVPVTSAKLHESRDPDHRPILIRADSIQPSNVAWLWLKRIPLGRITLLVGNAGDGKSFLTMDITARVTTGAEWPDGTTPDPGSVILISAEDDPADTIRPRLTAQGADLTKVHLLQQITLDDVDTIEAAIKEAEDCKLVVVDPIGDFLVTNANSEIHVRQALQPINELASVFGVAVLLVAHPSKAGAKSADDRVLGSRAFTAVARAVWHLIRDAEDESRRLLLPGKNNLAPANTGLAFSICGSPARVEWETEPVDISADDALAALRNRKSKPGPPRTEVIRASKWLREALAQGPRTANELTDEWTNGHSGSEKTLERAKKELSVKSEKKGDPNCWIWSLPSKNGGQLGDLVDHAKNTEICDDSDRVSLKNAKFDSVAGDEAHRPMRIPFVHI